MGKPQDVLGPVDTAFLYAERPETPMNIGALAIFEGKIPFEHILKLIDARIHQAPLYQTRLVQAPLNLGQPRWAFDPDFYVERHISRITLDPPGDDEQLRNVTGRLISKQLDRSKPLWEICVIEGLSGDRTGVLFKIHHCMVDGLSAVELVALLLDFSPALPNLPRKPLYDQPRLPTGLQLLVESLQKDIPFKISMLEKLGSDLGHLVSVISDKEARRKTFVGVANLINDNLQPIKRLPINGSNSGKMTIAWSEFPLAEVRAIRAGRKASINEVMLCVVGTAVENYIRQHGAVPGQDFLRVLVPINMRLEEEKGTYGNRISVLPMDIRFGISDPLDRLQKVAEYSTSMKQSSLSIGLDMVLTLPALAPGIMQPFIWSLAPTAFALLAHTWCTNVAGPPLPVYLAGHQLLHSYGYFPLNASMGLASVIMSYNDQITITLVADGAIIPDITELKRLVDSAYEQLRTAAKVPAVEPASRQTTPEIAELGAPAIKALPPPTQTIPEVLSVVEKAKVVLTNDGTIMPEVAPEKDIAPLGLPAKAAHNDKPRLFTEEWAQAYQKAINSNHAYRMASLHWEAGSLAFVLRVSPRDGITQARAVLMDLHKGDCRSAHSLSLDEACYRANFVIEADYQTWMRVLEGRDNPLFMLIRGKLALRKGALTRLLPFTQSAQELVRSAQLIP